MRKNPPTFRDHSPDYKKSVYNSNAHGAASAGNLGFCGFERVDVQVGHLGLSDLGDLSLGDGANLLLVGNAGTLVQTDRLGDQQGGSEESW